MNIKEVKDSIAHSREEIKDTIMRNKTFKYDNGIYDMRCVKCGESFSISQSKSGGAVEKLCPKCRDFGGKCVCGKDIPFGTMYCSECLSQAKNTELFHPSSTIFSVLSSRKSSHKYNTKVLTIIKENIDNIDYSHFLNFHDKGCSRFHGHQSYGISLSIEGYPQKDDMIIDFGDLKGVVKSAIIDKIDHKLLVHSSYVTDRCGNILVIQYDSGGYYHRLELPEHEVFVCDFEPTIENMCNHFCREVANRMPSNVLQVGLFMREGLNNGCMSFCNRF